MTIPSEVLEALRLDVGAQVDVVLTADGFAATLVEKSKPRRYALRALLCGATPDTMRQLQTETGWANEGTPVGREL